ncbi:MAG: Ig-like domain-containing protein, partial [Duncaniella sp.]|nr:Ig-like domain-containing protein [Duncaniella sp.]
DITDHKNNNFTETINVYCYSLDWVYDEQYTCMATGDSIQVSMNIRPSIMLEDFNFSYSCSYWKDEIKVDRKTGMVKTSQAGTYEIKLNGTIPPSPYVKISSSIKINVFDPIIKFDNNIYSISCDESVKINKECYPYEFIDGEWSVTDGTIATIDQEGNVKGLTPGYCEIIYRGKTKGGVLVEGRCGLEVKEIFISNLELSETNLTLDTGDTYQLTATISPENVTNQNILWQSSNTDVAEVSEQGLVTAIAAGEAVITASCGDITAECSISVLPNSGMERLLADPAAKISVYSVDGILIKKDCSPEDLNKLAKGIYIVVYGKDHYKISI